MNNVSFANVSKIFARAGRGSSLSLHRTTPEILKLAEWTEQHAIFGGKVMVPAVH